MRRGLVSKNDLARSHIQYDFGNKQYVNTKLNVALIQTGRHQKKFNAQQIIEKYGDSYIFNRGVENPGKTSASTKGQGVQISQIHLSSKNQYETQDGSKRMDKELFGNLLQIENSSSMSTMDQTASSLNSSDQPMATRETIQKMPYYACESKIQLSIDDLFG